jgi:uncharacterized protein (DUF1778 family)
MQKKRYKEVVMPISLRIPKEKEEMINQKARKQKKSKTAFILEAIDEKLGVTKSREELIRETAGWLSREDARELRKAVAPFAEVHEEDWR